MSDNYMFQFTFTLRDDTPAALRQALRLLSEGQTPPKDLLAGFPGMAQIYLETGGMPGDGVHSVENGLVRMTRTFHDDEFFNGGEYFVWWLVQYATGPGPVGVRQQINGLDMPEILVKDGDLLITARTGYDRSDGGGQVAVTEHEMTSISGMLEALADFRDGYSYE